MMYTYDDNIIISSSDIDIILVCYECSLLEMFSSNIFMRLYSHYSRPASLAQWQSVGLGIERSRVRNTLVPSGFSPRQGN